MTGAQSLREESPLLGDLYQLAMFEAYLAEGMVAEASFELFVRRLPPQRNFLMAAGLEQVIGCLEAMRLGPAELEWLRAKRQFRDQTLDALAAFRFTGDVDAMPEGTVFFADEPILRVTAPLPQAQLVESRLLNLVHFETAIASKAARLVLAAQGRELIDFGFRRAHGVEAGILAARASYLAGFAGTATLRAGFEFGIPTFGTMAHSFVQAHDSEARAFEQFARTRPEGLVLLLDTYDTIAAAGTVVEMAPRLALDGIRIGGVRLDSGDLEQTSRAVRAILDAGGLHHVRIVASGGLEEQRIARIVQTGSPIDAFGVGSSLAASADAPVLDCAYKLVEYEGRPRRKLSSGKATWPARKQVCRHLDREGRIVGDRLALADEPLHGRALLVPAMRSGKRVSSLPTLTAARTHAARELETLPDRLQSLTPETSLRLEISDGLRETVHRCDASIAAANRADGAA